jgi:hypothetical protein
MNKAPRLYMDSRLRMYKKTRTRLPFDNSYVCDCGARFDASIKGNTEHCGKQMKKTYSFINGVQYL